MFSELQQDMDERAAKGLLRQRQTLASQQSPHIQVEGRAYLSFCSNDYLGLANHPALKEAAIRPCATSVPGRVCSRTQI